ncbi:MAG: ABC transporter permease [Rubellimicrobium sp.]|nr:ABC transporter permease [Rubellimicrobium sp.]
MRVFEDQGHRRGTVVKGRLLPVLAVVAALFALWYVAVVPMNIREVLSSAEREGAVVTPSSAVERQQVGRIALVFMNLEHIGPSWSSDRSRLPSPHQVAREIWASTWDEEVNSRRGIVQTGSLSNRSLIHHGIITLSATVVGFLIGAGLGVLLAIGIVHNRAMDMSVMPWAIVSQTIPIVAIAPMIIVVLNAAGVQGLLPKAIISAYLSFFPVVVGMVKGLRTPDAMQLDQMKTWSAGQGAVLWKLRLPASVPYLFASLKIAIAASLVGTIVGELPVQRGGLGARMLAGSYYGNTEQIWAALFAAALMAAVLIWAVGWIERRTMRAMGGQP